MTKSLAQAKKRIVSLTDEGYRQDEIADTLNKEGFKTKRGGDFTKFTVSQYLTGKTKVRSGRSKKAAKTSNGNGRAHHTDLTVDFVVKLANSDRSDEDLGALIRLLVE